MRGRGCRVFAAVDPSSCAHDRTQLLRGCMIFSRFVRILKSFLDWVRCKCTSSVSTRGAGTAQDDSATMAGEQPPTRDEFPYKLYVQNLFRKHKLIQMLL
jgi:hypothetical protein